jgi:hypothetical protein
MKPSLLYVFVLLMVCFIASCDQDRFDYRHKYVGDFDLSVHYESVWQPNMFYDFEYAGEVYAVWDDRLAIRYDSTDVIEVTVDKKGVLTKDAGSGEFSGSYADKDHFSTREVYFTPTSDLIVFEIEGSRHK